MSANNCHNCSYCKSVAAVEVTGDDHAIKREFERIERNQPTSEQVSQSLARTINTNIRLLKAYEEFEQIADDLGVSIEDIINAQ